MSDLSAFDVLGPVMIGPSSSHTAGALRISRLAASLAPKPITSVEFILYNSFRFTYQGHGSDRALAAGILGMRTDDARIRDAIDIARKQGIDITFTPSDDGVGKHPNTVDCIIRSGDNVLEARGESLGGGQVQLSRINGIDVKLSGDFNTLFVSHRDQPGALGTICDELGNNNVNIAFMSSYRQNKGGMAYSIFENDSDLSDDVLQAIRNLECTRSVIEIKRPTSVGVNPGVTGEIVFECARDMLQTAKEHNLTLGEAMRMRETALLGSVEEADSRMRRVLEVMREEVSAPITEPCTSMGGLIGGEAQKVMALMGTRLELAGPVMQRAIAYALATLERSAGMGLIVAAPTAGSSGVVPAGILSIAEQAQQDGHPFTEEQIMMALFNAAAIGYLISRNATVAGAEGGCQAEVGSAAAMAASAIVELMGGDNEMCTHAASFAITNILGLVCDPVGGLVEAPCQARNALGVTNAISAAQMALAGMKCLAPLDEVIEIMYTVGKGLPASLRETGMGGLAATPTACSRCAKIFKAC